MRLESAAALNHLLFCLTFVVTCNSTSTETISGLLHNTVSINFSKPDATIEIACKREGNKVFEWEQGKNTTYFEPFLEKFELQIKNNRVYIQRLEKNYTGHYLLEFTQSDGQIVQISINLIVIEPLARPEIVCIGNDSVVFLSCELNHTGSYDTTWNYQKSDVISKETTMLSNENKHLTILNPRNYTEEFICVVKQTGNRNQSDPFLVQSCIEPPENHRQHHILIIPFVLLALVIALVCILYRYYAKKKQDGIKVEEPVSREPQNTELSQDDIKVEEPVSREPQNTELSQDEPVNTSKRWCQC
ncbi:uncharacterized protein LOC119968968 isoform X2 [Scyliorhinus canicula]|uniref:uncharacterized protein LOC119968968 isoform X2 n=1 Tax=Scyliorhinus canicula TaxID=7830 RepID=UPI0018F4FA3E|nr:uncharacterized protein LOC119968968 isoform X2 [Scyliorhinus canicula]